MVQYGIAPSSMVRRASLNAYRVWYRPRCGFLTTRETCDSCTEYEGVILPGVGNRAAWLCTQTVLLGVLAYRHSPSWPSSCCFPARRSFVFFFFCVCVSVCVLVWSSVFGNADGGSYPCERG